MRISDWSSDVCSSDLSLVVDHSTALADRQELMLVAERDRIARDLHDVVIQRIFATGLQLQGVRKRIHDEEVAAMLSTALTDLDTTIRDIRSTIFELQHTRKVSRSEEHTSELQSLMRISYAVFCLKKK